MEEQNSEFQKKLNDWLYKVGDYLTILGQRILELLQKFWSWYKSINWPDIPLTAFQLLVLFYVIFGSIFMVSTPILEASDELWHFGMVEYLRENNGQLPVYDVSDPDLIYENNRDTIYRQEGSQPPLYYYTMALLSSPFDISDAEQYRIPNPHVRAGEPGSFANKNLVLHPVDGVPLTGTPLAIYVMRLFGIAMGIVTIWAVWQSGELIAPHRPVVGLLAGVLTAFNPMFLFISASVNNDTMVIMLNSVVILLALQTLREGFDLRRSLLLAILLGLATLTKLSALVLVPVIAVAGLWVARRDKDLSGVFILGIAMFVAWVTIAGWWYVRNFNLYGELFGTQTMAMVAGVREDPYTFFTFLGEFEGFRQGYWGVFGAFSIITSPLVYAIADFIVFVGIFGVIFLVSQLVSIQDFSFARREISLVLFLLGIVLIGIIAYLNWTSMTYASQGRLLFPFFAAISPLLAVGLIEILWWVLFLLSPPDRSYVRAGDAVPEPILRESLQWPVRLAGFIVLLIPILTILPQYRAPRPIELADIPDDANRIFAEYDNIRLIGYDAVDRRYLPGERVRFTLYWEVIEPTEDDLTMAIALVSPFGDEISTRTISTYPGGGTLRTSTWEAGDIYADTYELTLLRNVHSRYPFDLSINWYDEIPEARVTATNENDSTINVLLDIGAVIRPNLPVSFSDLDLLQDEEANTRTFGRIIRLEGFAHTPPELEENNDAAFIVDALWESQSSIETDYIAFLHVYNSDGELVTQYDFQYQLPTRYWTFNENFRLIYPVTAPENGFAPDTYTVNVGWYEKDNPEIRLNIIEATDEDPAISTYQMFEFTVNNAGEIILPELEIDNPTDDLPDVPLAPTEEDTPEAELTQQADDMESDEPEATAESEDEE
ncbi:MAG: DUF2142 domain-containing protein [Chloroflexota bacterium]